VERNANFASNQRQGQSKMKRLYRASVLVITVALTACAQTYEPVVDMEGVDPAKYAKDLAGCRKYAKIADPAGEAVAGALLGAAFGAALGAATGATVGQAGCGASYGTAVGGASGLAAGGASGMARQIRIICHCLTTRGYSVLD
jgi:hypothetical protein